MAQLTYLHDSNPVAFWAFAAVFAAQAGLWAYILWAAWQMPRHVQPEPARWE